MGYKYTFQKAYFAGGNTGTNVNTIDALVFSSETDSTLSAVLSSARYALAGANSGGNFVTDIEIKEKINAYSNFIRILTYSGDIKRHIKMEEMN